MDDESYQKIKDYALKLLSFRPRSIAELQTRIKKYSIKKGIDSHLLSKLLDELTGQNLLNDEEFVRWWLDQRQTFKPKGIYAVGKELEGKGIDREVIDKVVADTQSQRISDFDLALRMIAKKVPVFKNLGKDEFKMKVRNLLLRRGFSFETIKKVIDVYSQKE